MRVLLIDPPWYSLQGISSSPPALGLAYLGSYLKEKGKHDVLIFSGEVGITKMFRHQKVMNEEEIDLKKNPAYKKVLSKLVPLIERFRPDILGITMPTAKYEVVTEMVKFLNHRYPSKKIILGGPHPTIVPEDCFKIKGVELVVRGEGEITFLELINELGKKKPVFSKIKGLSYRKGKKILHNPNREMIKDLDELPFPDWGLLHEREIVPKNLLGHIISSRGCPYQCIFCASKKMWGLNVRFRSSENIIKEIQERKRKYGVDVVVFNDDSFTLKKDRAIVVMEKLKELKINWKCDTRVNLVTYDLLKKMKATGCVQLNLGVECGNDRMLKYVKKGINVEQVKKAFKMTGALGIGTVAYFMIGFPDETKQDIYDAVRLMKEIKPNHPTWSTVTPYPGTELYDICQKEGLISKEIDWSKFHHHSKDMSFSKHVGIGEIRRIAKKIEKITFRMKLKYYLTHPKRLLKELKII